MKQKLLYTALLSALISQTAWADGATNQRLNQMEQRLQLLEQRLQQQQQMLNAKDQQIAQLQQTKSASSSGGNKGLGNVTFGGLIEVEATHSDPESGDSTNDIAVATVELAITAPISEWVESEIVLLYEEDDTELDVDSAFITVAPPESFWLVSAGKFAQPFGRFDTNLVSDPLTLELGETFETSLLAGVDVNGFMASAYVFNGDNSKDGDDTIDNFGLDLGYGMERGDMAFNVALGYINNIGDTDNMQDTIGEEISDYVDGWFASAAATFGPVSIIGEYVGAGDNFQASELEWKGEGAQPITWNIEAAYAFQLATKEAHIALGYQGTDEALGLELPQNRWLLAFSVGIFDNTSLSFEWAHDEDYDTEDGGTGESTNNFTAQLAVEF